MNIGKTSPFQSNFTPFQIIYGTHLLYKRRLEKGSIRICYFFKVFYFF